MKKILIVKNVIVMFAMVVSILMWKNEIKAATWQEVNGDFYYVNENTRVYQSMFIESNGKKYVVDADGKMMRDTAVITDNTMYYAKNDGSLARNEFININLDVALKNDIEAGLYFFGDNYKIYKRTGSNFKKVIDGETYAVDEGGLILTGWLDIDGARIENGEDIIKEGIYFADENGIMYKNKWYNFTKDINVYEINNDDTVLNNLEYDNASAIWIYFDHNGKKVKADDELNEKMKVINNRKYVFDENGIMVPDFTNPGALDTSVESNPTLKKKVYIQGDENNGARETNKWLWLFPSKNLDEQEWKDQEYSWWYAGSDGKIINNTIKKIDNKKYAFDGIGRMKAGFVFYDGKYVANYNQEDLVKDDFIYGYMAGGRLYGHELADLRYFGEDEKEDAFMRTGEIDIELGDGVYHFRFNDNGVAFGNKNIVRKYKNKYYLNGLLLEPNDEYKYGILKENVNTYKLIKDNGTIAKGTKKVIKDDDGNYILMMGNEVVGYKTINQIPGDSIIKYRRATNTTKEGFWYYDQDKDAEDKWHYGMALDPNVVTSLSADDIDNLEEDMKINFR